MKTQTIEVDDDTATVLKQRAAELGVSVPQLVAELVMHEAGPAQADGDDVAELDLRWKAFEAQGSVAAGGMSCGGSKLGVRRHSGTDAIDEA
ncbi:hypothetical protein [Bradyrhizobium sp.]|uniref:hypothetical protein n=1 Tax=Bradyrhizobium sp. TaxID=376 RepID=UPI003BAF89CC